MPHATRLARQGITFEHVSFAYGTAEPVLVDVVLEVPVGSLVAVVGPSGAGKKTLTDLLLRSAGRIAIDGIDVRDVTLASLRARVAVVGQLTFLFDDTVHRNIACGDPR